MKRQKIVQILILAVGVILILGAIIYSPEVTEDGSYNMNLNTIFLSIGCSIIAVVIINFVEYHITLPEVNLIKVVNSWRLVSIFETRQEMNATTNKLIKDARELDIAALGSRGLIDFQGEVLKEGLKKGLKIRFLVPQKDSEYIAQRELDENAHSGSITKAIEDLISWVENTKNELNLAQECIEVREYPNLPIESIMRIDDQIFTGPFMVYKGSQTTMAYQYEKKGLGFKYYSDYFNSIWKSKDTVRVA
ncbi:hypothetical protein ACWO25_004211 [Vibrio parahaemolyticus]|jgi:hypothetical protein|uniref:hypothetical protein n=1 Tax=Vibrio TaxID=662 RepID=UPI001A330647|nr:MULTISPECIES: hypothetical protein [Vibrio]EGQ7920093.1 hypothetical protein [Vibrio parahaemolyticus]EGQ9944396.1 hypothetical protein [Vibrio parahaemolyticus]EGR0771079.1 hypothetical protein [Vibrio parahaemolyticus]EGR0840729.1 hypothetical protein [Vibrio parahaemolyticus]EJL7426820.1 hypothetical protein [Vibrio parahaemolyticus]